jgi:hypothetical protein
MPLLALHVGTTDGDGVFLADRRIPWVSCCIHRCERLGNHGLMFPYELPHSDQGVV